MLPGAVATKRGMAPESSNTASEARPTRPEVKHDERDRVARRLEALRVEARVKRESSKPPPRDG
jgi:hypothetical protein